MELLKTSKDLKYWFLNYVILKSKIDKLFHEIVLIQGVELMVIWAI